MSYSLRPYQQEAVDCVMPRLRKGGKPVLLSLGTGCHAKGSQILMADGTTKNVEDIRVGDMLMGVNEPRKVLTLHNGTDQMYRITPVKGESFIVNGGHILHIRQYERKLVNGVEKTTKICRNISVNEWLTLPKTEKAKSKLVNLQKKNQYFTGFTAEPLGKGEYYGFTLDGDHLYLDAQMFIHHNSGKTWVLSEIARLWGDKVLVLTLSKELCDQDYDKLCIVAGEKNVGMYSASWNRKEVKNITVATIQSAYRHPELWKDHKLVIIDECDMSLDGMVASLVKDKTVLGLTATAYATQGSYNGIWYTTKIYPLHKIKSKELGWFWQPVEMAISEKRLTEEGYLSPLKIYSSPIDCSALKMNSNGSEYTTASIDEWVDTAYVRILEVMEGAEKNNMCTSGIIFLPSVQSCEKLERICEKIGFDAKAVSSKTPKKEREKIIQDHKDGKLRWLINMGVCVRGFDNPRVDCLLIARPSKSLRLVRQYLGRGLRLAEGKTHCNVFDLTENSQTWGGSVDVEMGKNGWQDTILLRGKDISGMEISKISMKNIRKHNLDKYEETGIIKRKKA